MPYRFQLLGGPDDGQLIESDSLPEVIDGESFHFYGSRAYVLIEVDYDNKTARYEHIKVGGKMDEGETSDSNGV